MRTFNLYRNVNDGGSGGSQGNYPTSVTIAGTTYLVDEHPELKTFLTTAITAAAEIEKGKLYSRISTLEGQVASANTQLQDTLVLTQRLQGLALQPQQQPAPQQQNQPIAQDVTQNAATNNMGQTYEIMKRQFEEALARIPGMLAQAVAPLEQRQRMFEVQTVSSYRDKLLADNRENIIPEMVQGNTIEELNANLERSKTAYAQLAARFAPVRTVPQQQPAANNMPLQQVPAQQPQQRVQPLQPAPQAPPMQPQIPVYETSIPDIANMSAEEFANNRDSLFAQIKQVAEAASSQYTGG